MRRTESGHAATLLVVLLAAACERGEFDRRPLHVYAASSPTDAFADGHVAGSDRARLLGGFTMPPGGGCGSGTVRYSPYLREWRDVPLRRHDRAPAGPLSGPGGITNCEWLC